MKKQKYKGIAIITVSPVWSGEETAKLREGLVADAGEWIWITSAGEDINIKYYAFPK